jgi:hypothetical protein
MSDNTSISENTADALYDAATAQYALHTLEQLRREYDLASPDEQEAINNLIERGAQIVFNSDLPEAYVTVDQWTQIRPHKWGIGDWSDAIREIFIEDDHYVSSRAFAGACHFENPTAYVTFYPLNRYNLVYSRLYDLVTKASSKPHSAFPRPLGSRFTEVSVAQQYVGPTYILSTRV